MTSVEKKLCNYFINEMETTCVQIRLTLSLVALQICYNSLTVFVGMALNIQISGQ